MNFTPGLLEVGRTIKSPKELSSTDCSKVRPVLYQTLEMVVGIEREMGEQVTHWRCYVRNN